MILNHNAAIEYLVRGTDGSGNVGINTETFLGLHVFLSDGMLQDPQTGGRVRTRAVDIAGSVYRPIALPPTTLDADRNRFVALIPEEFNALHAGNAIRLGVRPLEFEAARTKHRVRGSSII